MGRSAGKGDRQIGVTEMFAIAMPCATLAQWLEDGCLIVFCDNQGSLHGYIQGASTIAEMNICMGEQWLRLLASGSRQGFSEYAQKKI